MPQAKTSGFEGGLVELARMARALGHPARVEILRQLARRGECACMSLVEDLPLSQPACSRHVAELVKSGWLLAREEGRNIFYRVDAAALERFCRGMDGCLHPPGAALPTVLALS
jgi:ArsR family transcriptional regulator, arsenate/arsenite/antimonite-responsive transcriptional repressor